MTKVKTKGGGFKESFSESFRALSTLVKMQLKEKMDMSYLRSKRALIFKLVWLLVEFASITAVLTVVFNYTRMIGLFSLAKDIPVDVISLVFAVMLLLSVITDTVGLMKSLYFSKDNTVLLTFPATPSLVFFSKLVVYYIYELRKSFMFTIPMFIAFGIAKGYGIFYYPWLILMFFLVSVLPVLLSALLSIPSMYIYVFLNRFKLLQYILYIAAAILGIAAVWYIIGLIPDDINFIEMKGELFSSIQTFISAYTKNFAIIYAFTELIAGRKIGLTTTVFHPGTLPALLVTLGVIAALALLCFLLSKPLFYRMASTPFEFKKKNYIQARTNSKRSPFISAVKKEFTIGLRSNAFIKLGGVLVVIMPMAIFLLNKFYGAMRTRLIGTQMTICFSVMIMLMILLMTNIDIASVYSRDGSSSYLNKVQPAPYVVLLLSKLFFPMIIAFAGTVLTVSLFAIESSIKPLDAVMLGISVYAIYIAHMFSSAESDIMNPQYEQYATFNEQTNNPNETRSGIFAIIFSVIIFVIALFLGSRADAAMWIKVAAISVAFAAVKVFTYFSKIKAFYKEKQ